MSGSRSLFWRAAAALLALLAGTPAGEAPPQEPPAESGVRPAAPAVKPAEAPKACVAFITCNGIYE